MEYTENWRAKSLHPVIQSIFNLPTIQLSSTKASWSRDWSHHDDLLAHHRDLAITWCSYRDTPLWSVCTNDHCRNHTHTQRREIHCHGFFTEIDSGLLYITRTAKNDNLFPPRISRWWWWWWLSVNNDSVSHLLSRHREALISVCGSAWHMMKHNDTVQAIDYTPPHSTPLSLYRGYWCRVTGRLQNRLQINKCSTPGHNSCVSFFGGRGIFCFVYV